MSKKNFFCSGQATIEYILITIVVAIVVIIGFQNNEANSFVRKSREQLDNFTITANNRINQAPTNPLLSSE